MTCSRWLSLFLAWTLLLQNLAPALGRTAVTKPTALQRYSRDSNPQTGNLIFLVASGARTENSLVLPNLASNNHLETLAARAGEGSKGIIVARAQVQRGYVGPGDRHAFNFIYRNGKLEIVDGQSQITQNLEYFKEISVIFTKKAF